jgi:hypothetical protein
MQYLVKNITPLPAHDGSYTGSKTIWVEGSPQGNCYPIGPQETLAVADTAKDLLLANYPDIIQVVDTYLDDDAPIGKVVTLPGAGAWLLVTLGKYCTQFQFNTTSTNCLVSFSGWDAAGGQTAPPVDYQIPIPTDVATPGGDLFTLNMTMNPSKTLYVSGVGSLTIIGI